MKNLGLATHSTTSDSHAANHLSIRPGIMQSLLILAVAVGVSTASADSVVLDLRYPDAEADRMIYFPYENAYGGIALTSGDFDGNGTDEIIMGSPFMEKERGRVDILHNAAAPVAGTTDVVDLAHPPAAAAITTLVGTVEDGWLGSSVAVGDFNADGRDDLAVGAPNVNLLAGAVYLFLGGNPCLAPGRFDVSAADIVLHGAGECDGAGPELVFGDLNGDGIDDLVISAPFTNKKETLVYADRAYILYGSPLRATGQVIQLGTDYDVLLRHIFGNYRSSVNSNGYFIADVLGDGIPDLIIGCQYGLDRYGHVYVVRGAPRPTGSVVMVHEEADLVIVDDRKSDMLGAAVGAGDVDGDGDNDLLIGSPNGYSSSYGKLSLLLFNGKPDPAQQTVIRMGQPTALYQEINYYGIYKSENLGQGLTLADFNADGIPDIAVGAFYGRPPGTNKAYGSVYVLPGRANWPVGTICIGDVPEILVMNGATKLEEFGLVLATGNFGGGAASLLVSSRLGDGRFGSGVKNAGQVYQFSQVLFDSLAPLNPKAGIKIAEELYRISGNWMKPKTGHQIESERMDSERIGPPEILNLYKRSRKAEPSR
ncbi:MAG TPA: FG-GAP repeat protein [bacterium]|nr:FG-GAP repeat protein [bacterium]HQP98060.1 FG-GAP repeat protein [bacterium]